MCKYDLKHLRINSVLSIDFVILCTRNEREKKNIIWKSIRSRGDLSSFFSNSIGLDWIDCWYVFYNIFTKYFHFEAHLLLIYVRLPMTRWYYHRLRFQRKSKRRPKCIKSIQLFVMDRDDVSSGGFSLGPSKLPVLIEAWIYLVIYAYNQLLHLVELFQIAFKFLCAFFRKISSKKVDIYFSVEFFR